ncbi:Nucleoid occlusion factor SlmA [bacterium HR11]|nr:Nucleoid occlusion factor SlmA [bacterium HR11]
MPFEDGIMPWTPRVRERPAVRERLLAVARQLFARYGYEHVSTAAIARLAGTSESQLFRHFVSKADLLLAIFEETWRALNERLQGVLQETADVRTSAVRLLAVFIEFFTTNPDVAFLMLFEGRRVRGDSRVALSRGFLEFTERVRRLVERGQQEGVLPGSLNPAALAVALVGAAEGMVRDWVMAQRFQQAPPYSLEDVQATFVALMNGLAAVARSAEEG